MTKILVIDDDKDLRERLKRLLELNDYQTYTAENGEKGLEIFDKESPQIALVDIRMPGIDGIEVLKKIKQKSEETEIIIITGHGAIDSAIEAVREGAFSYIQKPIEYERLSLDIKSALEKQEMRRKLDEYVHNLEQVVEEKNREITRRERAEAFLQETNRHLEETLAELKETQQQIIQQERLHALGQMAAGIAHDFNNALASILGYAELLFMVPATLDDKEKTTRYLETMHFAAKDASEIVTRLRKFYREREEVEIFSSVNLNQLVEQVIKLTEPKWKHQAQLEGITISVRIELQEVPHINGKESELRNVLTNLIFNAVDALSEGGTITIRIHSDGKHVVLEVSDTGMGMTDEVKRRCFEPFFSTKKESGTGLGLSVAYGIIRRHEGTIEVLSEPGEGTTFIIRLPIPAEAQEGEEQEAKGSVRPLHVLLIDDDRRGRDIITEYLLVDGHTVETVNNGREGLEKFYKGRYDLVITDMAMPDMNGLQLAALIKQIAPNKPIIMLTGFGDTMRVTGDIPAEINSLLNKPVTLNNFREALAKVTAEKDTHI